MNPFSQKKKRAATLLLTAAIAAALALSTTAIINPLAAYADWPKVVTYTAENEEGFVGSSSFCEHPEKQSCKETFGANLNQATKSDCQQLSDEFLGGEKCKKTDEPF
jgi:hypothetical protein